MYLGAIDKTDTALQIAPIALSFIPVVGWIGAAALIAANAARAASAIRKQKLAQAIQKRNIENAQKEMAHEQAQLDVTEKSMREMSVQRALSNSFAYQSTVNVPSKYDSPSLSKTSPLALIGVVGVALIATVIILRSR